ncbi:MAG TPA: hypothetical protein VKZ18_15930 [Polyangia bacterium]|nr:hypothetical protein [Polyangia bacterium]
MADSCGSGWTQDDWYRDGEDQIHFFPFSKVLLWTKGKKILAQVEAWGGENPRRGIDYGKMKPHLTTPGGYVISGWGPYVTQSWDFSAIRWGTPLKMDPTREHVLYRTDVLDKWERTESVNPKLTKAAIYRRHWDLYGYSRRYDSDGDGIPEQWVFNDFGPVAINYFCDPNRNRKHDPGEKIMGEKIHTTAENEAQTTNDERVKMEYSHACIHVRPLDLRRLLRRGAFKRGMLLFVHENNERLPESIGR